MREAKRCEGTRKGHACGGNTFKCSNPECGSVGCEKSGCDNRQFVPIQRCKDCGHAYERIQQFEVAPIRAEEGAGTTTPGVRIALPNIELLFGAVLGLAALAAAVAGLMGAFGGVGSSTGAGGNVVATAPSASVAPLAQSYADICQCYRQGMALAGTGVTVLSSQYRTGFMQCRAVFGAEGGDAWTAGWTARSEGKLVGAGCRSWLKRNG